ncbi:aldo/keto reductase [Amycolatopsis sp. cmx-4-61]|uniref:aldo/keto reductase n=1 Tax=Amycolatopsis sp. cmx-4-61 TaxID=2790937 RepID=UPI00397A515D
MGHNELLLRDALRGRRAGRARARGLRPAHRAVRGRGGDPAPGRRSSRGLLSGHWTPSRELTAGDFRGHSPRFQGENLDRNLALTEALGQIAAAKGVTTAQLAIAWVAAQGDDIVPLVGARTRARPAESPGTADVELTDADLAEIEAAVPAGAAAGGRYAAAQLDHLDSEK